MQAQIRSEEFTNSSTTARFDGQALRARAVFAERSRAIANTGVDAPGNTWKENLAPLFDVCDELGLGCTRAEVFPRLLELMEEFSGGMNVDIYEIEETGRRMVSVLSSPGSNPLGTVKLGEGIIGEVAATGTHYIAAKIDAPLLREQERGLCACLPLQCAGRVLGVIALYGDRGFTSTAIKLLTRTSTNAALALAWKGH